MFVSEGTIRLDPRGQGDLGERSAMLWLGERGCGVFFPAFHSPDFDLVAEWGTGLQRVQVKTSTVFRKERWDVMVCTRGGNQSWSGVIKHLDPSLYDWLFVLVGDGRRWFLPSAEVEGTSSIRLGGPKYEAREIEPGQPLPAWSDRYTDRPRRGTQAVNEGGL